MPPRLRLCRKQAVSFSASQHARPQLPSNMANCCAGAQISVTPIADKAGRVANFVAVQQDVTERKASEAAFQLRDHALSNLSEVMTSL